MAGIPSKNRNVESAWGHVVTHVCVQSAPTSSNGAVDLGEWASKGGEPVIHSDAASALALASLLLLVVMACSRA
jgi:hypothetical protein